MEEQHTKESVQGTYKILLVIGIIIIAFNLRPAITSVGPLVGTIRDAIGLSNWSAGILTSLPLIAFALMSPIAPKIGNRFTNEASLLLGLIVLLFGIGIRSISHVSLLFFGTLLVGLGIAILNVLLPGVIKEKFPDKVELMTGIYSVSMGLFAALASGVSVPFAKGLGLGWQLSLLIWGSLTVIGVIVWIFLNARNKKDEQYVQHYAESSHNPMWKAPLAWQVACFMGFQSLLFYVTISWLPEILHDSGLSVATAGWVLSGTQLVGLPFSFLVPVLAGKLKSQWMIVVGLGASAIIGFTGLLIGHSSTIFIISSCFIGITLGGCFPLALAFLGMRARTARQASDLSGMAQSMGYVLAAIGPIFIGYLYDLSHSWMIPLLTLIGITIVVIVFGSLAGRDRYVLDD